MNNGNVSLSIVVLSLSTFAATAAHADYSLREKQYMKRQEKSLAEGVKKTNKWCGTDLKAQIDWRSWKAEMNRILDGKVHRSIGGYCQQVPNTLWFMCKNDKLAKKAIARKVKRYTCKFGGKGKRAIKLSGDHMLLWIDWKAPNYTAYIKKYLGKML